MSDQSVKDLRTLTFTIGQMRQVLTAHTFGQQPTSIQHLEAQFNVLLEQEWMRQQREREG